MCLRTKCHTKKETNKKIHFRSCYTTGKKKNCGIPQCTIWVAHFFSAVVVVIVVYTVYGCFLSYNFYATTYFIKKKQKRNAWTAEERAVDKLYAQVYWIFHATIKVTTAQKPHTFPLHPLSSRCNLLYAWIYCTASIEPLGGRRKSLIYCPYSCT